MRQNNRELWLAFFSILAISAGYLFVAMRDGDVPRASGLVGHGIGIFGFFLMLVTETLYTFRKRGRSARWGRMSVWLKFHIFTGITGPYLVLLHTSWKYNGLAGLVMLMTVIVVLSGFIGRYIYTAIPRSADGIEIEADKLREEIYRMNADLRVRISSLRDNRLQNLLLHDSSSTDAARRQASHPGNVISRWLAALRWNLAIQQINPLDRTKAQELRRALKLRQLLERQIASLAMARRVFALWHTIHIPLGVTLFVAAFIHIAAAIYYATLGP